VCESFSATIENNPEPNRPTSLNRPYPEPAHPRTDKFIKYQRFELLW